MPLILPQPITPTLTGASPLMVAPFSRSALQQAALQAACQHAPCRELVSISASQHSHAQGLLADWLTRRRSRRADVLTSGGHRPERAEMLFSARPYHAAFDYLFGLWDVEVFRNVAQGAVEYSSLT